MAFDSSRLKAVSDFASLIVGPNLFQISELKFICDQWPHFLLGFSISILFFLLLKLDIFFAFHAAAQLA